MVQLLKAIIEKNGATLSAWTGNQAISLPRGDNFNYAKSAILVFFP